VDARVTEHMQELRRVHRGTCVPSAPCPCFQFEDGRFVLTPMGHRLLYAYQRRYGLLKTD
jgi:hypothetical protein